MSDNIGHNGGPSISDEDENPYGPEGFISLGRATRFHPLVGIRQAMTPADPKEGAACSKFEAWVDLIMECKYKAGTVKNKGREMTLERGQMLGATSFLARRWNWTPAAVRWFLNALEDAGMIERPPSKPERQPTERCDPKLNGYVQHDSRHSKQSDRPNNNQITVISVCNYEIYQYINRIKRQASNDIQQQAPQQANDKRTASAQQAHDNNFNKGNNEIRKEESPHTPQGAPPAAVVEALVLGAEAAAEPAKPRRGRKPSIKTELPRDWSIPPGWVAWALETFVIDEVKVRVTAQQFKNWNISKKRLQADWKATWENWCYSTIQNWTVRPSAILPAESRVLSLQPEPDPVDDDIARRNEEFYALERRRRLNGDA